jgi:hydroxymethylglutaryl-CoA reductase
VVRIVVSPIEDRFMRNVAEGALVASTNRGARAINASGGCQSFVYSDGMSRAPVVAMPTVREAVQLKKWIESPERLCMLKHDKDLADWLA